MRYEDALRALEERQEARMVFGLERVSAHLERLGSPQKGLRVIHAAGTNGKGSTCAILESVLRAAGYRTGLYTSPHLDHPRERIKVDGAAISEADFARLMERTLATDPRAELTYFELLTSMAFSHFARTRTDVVVLETGLGGRLDATNVVEKPLACVITSIDLDHARYLGDTLAKIAAEKAGIIKPGCPVICPDLPRPALKAIRARAEALSAPLTVVAQPWTTTAVDWTANTQELEDPQGRRWTLSLLGDRQGRNAALARAAVAACPALRVGPAAWRKGLRGVHWPGRFEVRREGGRTIVFDGAHNVEAVRHLRSTLEASPLAGGDLRFVLGFLKDKDFSAMIRTLKPLLSDVVVLRPASPRALEPARLLREVKRLVPGARVRAAAGFESALEDAPPAVVVCGSFYLVAASRRAEGVLS